MKSVSTTVRMYRVFRQGKGLEPCHTRPEHGETAPRHADMLRYDLGFHAPHDESIIVLPVFKHRSSGRSSHNITIERWRSFGLYLQDFEPCGAENLDLHSFIGYHHTQGYLALEKETLGDFLKRDNSKIVGWR